MSARLRLTRIMAKMGPQKPKLQDKLPAPNERSWSILRGDTVQIVGQHPEKGKQGKVLKVLRAKDRVIVQGINLFTQHIKGKPERGIAGRSRQIERAIPYAHVSLIDPVSNAPTRVHKQFLPDGSKVRVSKKSGTIIPRPELLKFRKRPPPSLVTDSDTLEEDVWEITYPPM